MPRNAVGKTIKIKSEVYIDDEGLKIELDFPIKILYMIGGKMLIMYFKDLQENKNPVIEKESISPKSKSPKLFQYRIDFKNRQMNVDVAIYYAGGVGIMRKKTPKKPKKEEIDKPRTLSEIKNEIENILRKY